MGAAHEAEPFEAVLTLGDNFYPAGVPVKKWVDGLPEVKVYPAFGNHDVTALDEQLKLFGVDRTYSLFHKALAPPLSLSGNKFASWTGFLKCPKCPP